MGADPIGLFRSPMPPVTPRHGMPETSDAEPASLWLRMAGYWLARHWQEDATAAVG